MIIFLFFFFFFFFKQKTAYEMLRSLVGSEMCIRDRSIPGGVDGVEPGRGCPPWKAGAVMSIRPLSRALPIATGGFMLVRTTCLVIALTATSECGISVPVDLRSE